MQHAKIQNCALITDFKFGSKCIQSLGATSLKKAGEGPCFQGVPFFMFAKICAFSLMPKKSDTSMTKTMDYCPALRSQYHPCLLPGKQPTPNSFFPILPCTTLVFDTTARGANPGGMCQALLAIYQPTPQNISNAHSRISVKFDRFSQNVSLNTCVIPLKTILKCAGFLPWDLSSCSVQGTSGLHHLPAALGVSPRSAGVGEQGMYSAGTKQS